MDAEALEFRETSFDVVLSLFALLHFPNPDIALEEMFRVLKPGGTMVVAVGSGPRWLSWQGLQHAVRISTDLVSRLRGRQLVAPQFLNRLVQEMIPATEQVEESPFARAGRNRTASLPQLVQAAGFENLREHWEGHETTLETVADFWDIQRTFSSIARKRLNRAQPERIAAVRKQFYLRAEAALAQGGKLTYPFAAFFVSARRPRQS
jgi:ubiquinone/menaquinone biosynthesis C-methylase UbiE